MLIALPPKMFKEAFAPALLKSDRKQTRVSKEHHHLA